MATKTVVFIGYSFRDYDFQKIYNYLKKEMNQLLPHCYVVTIDPNFTDYFNHSNVTVIKTDGAYFLKILREHLEHSKYLIPKNHLENIYSIKELHYSIHRKTSDELIKLKIPNLAYCCFFQDGISHALSYLLYHSKSGLSFLPDKIFDSIDNYKALRREKLKLRKYADIAYIDGYIEGLYSIFIKNNDEMESFPFWYLYGVGPVNEEDFSNSINENEIFHQAAEKYGQKVFKKHLDNDGIVLHHTPFL